LPLLYPDISGHHSEAPVTEKVAGEDPLKGTGPGWAGGGADPAAKMLWAIARSLDGGRVKELFAVKNGLDHEDEGSLRISHKLSPFMPPISLPGD